MAEAPASADERSDDGTPLRRNRDFMLLGSGLVISTVGMRISTLVYPLVILAVTRSPLLAGIAGTAQTAPFLLLYLPAGALVDRWDRKRVMLTADGVRVVLLGCLAAVLAARLLSYPQIIVTAFLDGACFVFFQVAESAVRVLHYRLQARS
jgi:MFS family permease